MGVGNCWSCGLCNRFLHRQTRGGWENDRDANSVIGVTQLPCGHAYHSVCLYDHLGKERSVPDRSEAGSPDGAGDGRSPSLSTVLGILVPTTVSFGILGGIAAVLSMR